ncbi:MAG: hypothetical protein R3E42_09220 [Burkholderiaceae bacterium]
MSGIDTVVLGCTHYPFAMDALQKAAAKRPVRSIPASLWQNEHGMCWAHLKASIQGTARRSPRC